MSNSLEPKVRLPEHFRSVRNWRQMAEIASGREKEHYRLRDEASYVTEEYETLSNKVFGQIFAGGKVNLEHVQALSSSTVKQYSADNAVRYHQDLGFSFKLIRLGAGALATDDRAWSPRGRSEDAVTQRVIKATAAGTLIEEFIGAAKILVAANPQPSDIPTRQSKEARNNKPAGWVELLRRQRCLPKPATLIAAVQEELLQDMPQLTLSSQVKKFIRDTLERR